MDDNNPHRKHLKCTETKESRWDRIQKKHINSVSPNLSRSNTVQQLFNMNFVNDRQIKMMSTSAECISSTSLDPSLVMQLRHESIRKHSKSATTINGMKELQMDKVKQHNATVEMKYLENQINKFKEEIANHRIPIKPMSDNLDKENNMLAINPLDNASLYASLHNGYEMVKNFYKNSCDASIEEAKLLSHEMIDELSPHDTDTIPSMQDQRCVRFDHFVEIINYAEDEPNTSQDCSLIDLESSEESGSSVNVEEPTEPTIGNVLAIELIPKKSAEPLELIGKQVIHGPTEDSCDEQPKIVKIVELSRDQKMYENTDEYPFRVTKIKIGDMHAVTVAAADAIKVGPSIEPDNFENTEQNTIINELFGQTAEHKEFDRIILQKYFLKWIHFTTIQKMTKENDNLPKNASRIRKIENFLDTIRMEKKKFTRKDTIDGVAGDGQPKKPNFEGPVLLAKKYQNKMKIQQDIIELQKLKLERQERLITELKLSNLSEEARESKAKIKDELKHVIRTGCQKNRLKAKCLQIANNLKDEDDEEYDSKLHARGTPKFLIEMEQRALERNMKHQEAQERRERLEQEKERQKIAAEEAKRQQDEEAKRLRIEELRQKRRKEKQLKVQRERERLERIENHQKANEFYRHLLLTRYGMDRFRILIKIKRHNMRKAIAFRKHMLVKNGFIAWKRIVNDTWELRKRKADECHRRHLLRFGLNQWRKYHLLLESKYLVAIDWHEMKLAERTLKIWDGYTRECKMIEEVKMRQAEAHYNWHLKWRVVDHWQRLHVILKIEKETEERRQRWRLKIWELLPDYKPNIGNDDSV